MPLYEGDNLVGIFHRIVLEYVMPAFWKYCQFTIFQMAIKSHPLLHIEKVAPVSIHHQGRAGDCRDCRTQVENVPAVASAVSTAELVKALGPFRTVPVKIFILDIRG